MAAWGIRFKRPEKVSTMSGLSGDEQMGLPCPYVDCESEKGFSKAKIGSRVTVTVHRSNDSHLAPYPTSTEGRYVVWSCL